MAKQSRVHFSVEEVLAFLDEGDLEEEEDGYMEDTFFFGSHLDMIVTQVEMEIVKRNCRKILIPQISEVFHQMLHTLCSEPAVQSVEALDGFAEMSELFWNLWASTLYAK